MEARRMYALTAMQIVGAGVLFWLLCTFPSPWNLQRYAGTVLAVIGVVGVAVARYQLGKSFAIKAEAHELVTTGVYSKIRNPIYLFGTVMITGLVLILQRPSAWIFMVAVIVGQTIRAHREAGVLEAAFGDAYREYRRKTWF
jgi:protein-S-isoprenylcysteine O-methyltransferase Ste14